MLSSRHAIDLARASDMLAPGVHWFDDWFAIQELAPGIHAIGEPRFHQLNWNYLIRGKHTALMFDTGPGVRDISPVVGALTSLPVIALPSHMHFDHTGNLHRFSDIAMADLPLLRACERDGIFYAGDDLFRGFREGMVWKPCRVRRWWPIGHHIDLGGRALEIIHTPGHTPDSISLLDRANNVLLAADFIYPGPLYAQFPGADLKAYLDTSHDLLALINDETAIYCAHGQPDDNGDHEAPSLHRRDIADLASALEALRKSGTMPKTWPVNSRLHLLAAPAAFAAWQKSK